MVIAAVLCAGASMMAGAAPMDSAPRPAAGPLAAGKNSDGRLELFQIGLDGQARHRWQKESNGDWSPWSVLGGSFLPGVAVSLDADGRLEVFAVDQARQLNCIRQKARDSHEWYAWRNLGGMVYSPVALGQEADGRLEVFAFDALSQRVEHLWQTNAHGGWSHWEDLGEGPSTGLAVATNHDGRLELFGVDERQHLVHCWQRQRNASTNWSAWASLGGAVLPGLGVGQDDDGRLEVFAVSANNSAVARLVQDAAGDSSRWRPWIDFEGDVRPGLTLGQNADGRLEVFAVKKGQSDVCHRWQLKPHEDNWSGWWGMGGAARPAPVIGRNRDGNLEIFAIDQRNDSVVNHRRQISANSDWLYWSSMDCVPFQYTSHLWQAEDGLPYNKVQAIAQTADGYLWVGTSMGLARFDGMQFRNFDARTTPELKDSSITALCVDGAGTLWIGTEHGGLACLQAGKFAHFSTTNGLAGNELRVIYEGRDHSLWIGTTHGLSRFHHGAFVNYTKKDGLLSEIIRALFEDNRGCLWIGTGGGLNLLTNGLMESYTESNGLPNSSIRAVCQDRGGRIWIGSDKGMIWYNTGHFYAYAAPYGLSDSFVSAIAEDSRSNLWVGTYSGLNRFIEGRFRHELKQDGLPYDQINALFEDHQGNIWVGSREGLIRLTLKPFVTSTTRQGLSHNNVTSVLEDRAGSLWLGTWGGGLDELIEENVKVYATSNRFPHDLVLSLCLGREDNLWIGADYDGGLVRWHNRLLDHYTWKNGLLNAGVRVLHEDRAGNLWIGTGRGLSCLRDGHFVNYTTADHLSGNMIRALCEDDEGNLWIGADGGLTRWKNGAFTNLSQGGLFPPVAVAALYSDSQENLWIGAIGCGLMRWHHGRFSTYAARQGISSDAILEIIEDDDGWLWMTSDKGIFRVLKRDLENLNQGKAERVASIAYGKADGLESTFCSSVGKPGAWKTRDGKLCFATTQGLAVIEPRNVQIHLSPPLVYIDKFTVDQQPASRPLGLAASQFAPATEAAIEIPPNRGELEFAYTALDFRAPEKCRFKYKLEGVNPDWIDAGSRRTAFYDNVSPGRYRFRVIACDKDGVWNESGAALAILLRPHFWQTWWFRTLALAALAGLAGGSARLVTQRKMQRQMELMERQHAIERERGRIAKDIHDDLGASLTRIMLLGLRAENDLAERKEIGVHLKKIVNFSRGTIQAMDEIVWAVNPRNDNLDGLVGYLTEFATQFFQDTRIRCRLQMPVTPQLTLSTEVRHDLFLVFKEALNNVLKHSQASEVHVEVFHAGSTVNIVIEDNGCGFDMTQGRNGRQGNGLRNMGKRMEALGGRMEITTSPGHGTKLQFAVRVPAQPPPQ
jgi:ligand-binding sensor domain-containing protein/signal transduction histidine kinase